MTGPADNEIWYTSTDGNIVIPAATDVFGANIVSNTYENGKGIIKFDNSVTSIGMGAFFLQMSLASIIIPNSVTSMGDLALWYCTNLTSITFKGTVNEWKAIDKGDYWMNVVPTDIIHCTDGDVEI